jgi:hypothetical protein
MLGYINASLHKYQHPASVLAEHVPHKWNPPVYGAKTQYIEEAEEIPSLSPKDVNCLDHHHKLMDPSLTTYIQQSHNIPGGTFHK